jgi:iron complex outermembrane recepter protein
MKKGLLLLLLLLSFFDGWTQSIYQFSFVSKNEKDEKIAVPDVAVTLNNTSSPTYSDKTGFLEMVIPDGNFAFVFEHPEYDIQSMSGVAYNSQRSIEIVLNPRTIVFNTVEVISSWIRENDPFTSSNFDKESYQRLNTGQDVPFILQWSPSVVSSSDAGAGIGYTGMSIRGSDPTRVNISINGVPVNDSESQGVFWVNMPDFSTSVDGVQIQRGVGSSTNGSVAFGATVNMSTQTLERNRYASVLGGLGSFGTRRYMARMGTGLLDGKYVVEGRISGIQSNGYVDRASADLQSWFFKAGYIGRKSVSKIIAFSGSEVTYQAWNGLPIQYLGNPSLRTFNTAGQKSDGTFYENEVDNYRQTHIHLIHHQEILPNWNYNATLHYTKGAGYFEQYRNQDRLSRYGISPLLVGNEEITRSDLIRRRWLDNHFIGGILNTEYTINKHRLNGGLSYNVYTGDHFGRIIWMQYAGTIPVDYQYYFNDATKRDASGFIKYSYQFHPKWSFFGDMQIRYIDYRFKGDNNAGLSFDGFEKYTFYNPKSGIYYNDSKGNDGYLSVAVGSREPNRDDFTNSTETSIPKSEYLYNAELGYQRSLNKWRFGLNAYLMYYIDQLALTGRINDVGAYTRVNVPESYRLGLEAQSAFDYRWIFGNGSLTISRNKIIAFTEFLDDWDQGGQLQVQHSHTDLALSPNVLAHALIGVRPGNLHYRHISLNPEIMYLFKYVGTQYLDNTSSIHSKLDPYSFSDFRIHVPVYFKGVKRMECRLSVNNIFNQSYVTNGWIYRYQSLGYNPVSDNPYSRQEGNGIFNDTGVFPQAGRNWLLSLEWFF